MEYFDVPDLSMTAVFRSGFGLVAEFPGLPYHTWVRAVTVLTSRQGPVNVYYSAITRTALIAQNNFGLNNTFAPVNARPIPWNAPVFVVWPNALNGDTGQATISRTGSIGLA